ncbi:hypothetical protein LX32DRAFT_200116 [Colletotrichum zoysiae]|uniref:Uncharacterized protein n=1 Tax=Colletotrichum zoysiae TaxID=1216348 RepID=A0AAD9M8B7_9PEZI|nr:hypothetical protein LX32DRAFT_200116 [Colletotrichum zoysiae]
MGIYDPSASPHPACGHRHGARQVIEETPSLEQASPTRVTAERHRPAPCLTAETGKENARIAIDPRGKRNKGGEGGLFLSRCEAQSHVFETNLEPSSLTLPIVIYLSMATRGCNTYHLSGEDQGHRLESSIVRETVVILVVRIRGGAIDIQSQ